MSEMVTTSRAVSGFPVIFNALLRPFMPAMLAFVQVLEFFDVDNYGTAFLDVQVGWAVEART